MPQTGTQLLRSGLDPAGALFDEFAKIARSGYVGIETPNLFRYEPDEVRVRRLFAESGLALCGCRAPLAIVAEPAGLAEEVRYLQSLGSRYLIVGGVGEQDPGLEEYWNAARLLNERGKQCAEAGIFLCYRPEEWELTATRRQSPGLEVLDQETSSRWVKYCVNLDRLAAGGVDPDKFIRERQERAVYLYQSTPAASEPSRNALSLNHSNGTGLNHSYLAAAGAGAEWLVRERMVIGAALAGRVVAD